MVLWCVKSCGAVLRVVVLCSHVCVSACVCVYVVVCVCVCVACVRVCACVCPSCRFEVNFSSGLCPITQAISWDLYQVRIKNKAVVAVCEVPVQVTIGSAKKRRKF